jgi:transposase
MSSLARVVVQRVWRRIAAEPLLARGDTVSLILPAVSTETMQIFLDAFVARLAANAQVALVLDGAGWHGSNDLVVSEWVSLVRLPPYAPEFNRVERIWLYLRERLLSHHVFADYDDILRACADAWRALTCETSRSLTAFPWLEQISS